MNTEAKLVGGSEGRIYGNSWNVGHVCHHKFELSY